MGILTDIHLGVYDRILLIGSPICAIIGSFANWAILEVNLSEKPITRQNGKIIVGIRSHLEVGFLIKWLSLRLLVGGILGFVFALYFVGIVKDDLNSIARILAFAVLLGYAAPKLWVSQEKLVQKYITEQLKKINNESKIMKDESDVNKNNE